MIKLTIAGLWFVTLGRPAQMVHTVHPNGFTVDHPAGWRIEASNNRIQILGPGAEFVTIEAIPNPKSLAPAQLLQ